MKKKTFTLLELLIVIGIIAILMTILLPSLSNSFEKSRRAVCKSNLSQLSKAAYSYASQNNSFVPDNYAGTGNHWHMTILESASLKTKFGKLVEGEYMEFSQTLYCPSNKWDDNASDSGVYNNGLKLSWDYNVNKWKANTHFVNVNYAWRKGSRAPLDLRKSESNEPFMADLFFNFSQRFAVDYFHKEGYNVVYVDGSAAWRSSIPKVSVGPSSNNAVYWDQDYFKK